MSDDLNNKRADAVECLEEMLYLAISGRATQDQITLCGKYFVTALAAYTIACMEASK